MNVDDLTAKPSESAIDAAEEALRKLASRRYFNGADGETTLREKAAAALEASAQVVAMTAKAEALESFASELEFAVARKDRPLDNDVEKQLIRTIKDLRLNADIYTKAGSTQHITPLPEII